MRGTLNYPPSSREHRSYWHLRRRMGRIAIGANQQIVLLNRQMLAAFLGVLDPDNQQTLQRRYLEGAYSLVHPDAGNAATLYAAIEQLDDLTEDQRTTVAALREIFERQHAHISGKMRESVAERIKLDMRGTFESNRAYREEWNVLRELGLEREELNARQIKPMYGILTPEQIARLPAWDFEENHRPRPWDFHNLSRQEDKEGDE